MIHTFAIAVHVLAAVLAVGLVGAVPITARLARRQGASVGTERILRALVLTMQLGLLTLLVTGVLLDRVAAGGFHHMRWFQLSMVVLVVLGFCLGRVRAAIRRAADADSLRQIERWGWAMCASVALITLLMQMKPLF